VRDAAGAEVAALLAAGARVLATRPYAQLCDLHLDPARGGARLVARDRLGNGWSVALAAADVSRMQSFLDAVDGRLGAPPARRWWLRGRPWHLRLLSVATSAVILLYVATATLAP
jgi:hypothetical protein